MKTTEFKQIIYTFYNTQLVTKYPQLAEKVYQEGLRATQAEHPFVVLSYGERKRIYKRFERYELDGVVYVRAQYKMGVTFKVYAASDNPYEADMLTDNVIDFTEYLFTDCEQTHYTLRDMSVTVLEGENSPIRDRSKFEQTKREFRKEVEIVFSFEDVQGYEPELGQGLDMDIAVK